MGNAWLEFSFSRSVAYHGSSRQVNRTAGPVRCEKTWWGWKRFRAAGRYQLHGVPADPEGSRDGHGPVIPR